MRAVGLLLLVLVAVSPSVIVAQEVPAEEQAQPQLLDQGELDQLVAPIALYPDPLLSQVLIASTYPLEVVQAERWAEKNKDLKGDALNDALAKEDWDDSVKALAAVPDVLAMMNEDLDWTAKLGDAVLAQQADVMDAIQRLRALAQSNGKLESNEQQTVTVTEGTTEPTAGEVEQAAQPVIVIEPTSPATVYVPYYQPSVVYGGWPYPDYPPYYFEPRPGYIFGGAIASGIAWSAGFAIGNAIWGDGFDWRGDNIRVNVNRNVNINNNNVNVSNWQHNSYHRRGVNYKNTEVRNKYSKGSAVDKRPDFRGRGDGLGDQKPGLGDRRPGGGNLADKKPDFGGKGPGGKGPGGKGPGGKGPGGGGLTDKKPDLGGKKPDLGKRPNVGDMQAALKQKPDVKKPDLSKKPNVQRPGGNAFDARDGAKAKDFAKRGQASAGNRSPSKIAPKKPAIKKPEAKKPAVKKPAVKKPAARKPAANKKPSIKKGGGGGGGKRRR